MKYDPIATFGKTNVNNVNFDMGVRSSTYFMRIELNSIQTNHYD